MTALLGGSQHRGRALAEASVNCELQEGSGAPTQAQEALVTVHALQWQGPGWGHGGTHGPGP